MGLFLPARHDALRRIAQALGQMMDGSGSEIDINPGKAGSDSTGFLLLTLMACSGSLRTTENTGGSFGARGTTR
jgi:hypothetical protein